MASPRDPITYEQVVAAIANIDMAGDKLTMRRLQSEVGGSNTTVLTHMRRWQETQRATAALGPEDDFMPTHLRIAMGDWMKDREAAARQEGDRRAAQADELYQATKEGWEEADERIEVLQKALASTELAAAEQQQSLSKQIAGQQARIEQSDKQVAELKEQVAREQRNAETSRVSAAEARIKADAAQESIKTLGKANEELRGDARTHSEAASEAKQRAAVAEERARNRDEQLVEARTAAAKAAAAAEELQKRLSDVEKKLSATERDLAVCREQHRGGGPSGGGQGGGNAGPEGGSTAADKPRERSDKGSDNNSRGSGGDNNKAAPPTASAPNALMRSLGKPNTPMAKEIALEMIPREARKLGHEVMRGATKYPRAPQGHPQYEEAEL